jgi:serine/threonine protein kinase
MYSAPEILNMEPYDERCDVWSLGVIIYFMIYATVPFLEKNIKKLKSIMTEKTLNSGKTSSEVC